MLESIKFKNEILKLEYLLVNNLVSKFNLLLNEFRMIQIFDNNNTKRQINFDTKSNNNIYQIKTIFEDEKKELMSNYNYDEKNKGYLTKYNLFQRDNINEIIQKRISLLLNEKLTILINNDFIDNNIQKIINIINEIIDNIDFNKKLQKIPNFHSNNNQLNTKKEHLDFFVEKINKEENIKYINISLYHNNKYLELARITLYLDNFFADFDININSIFIYIFKKNQVEEIIKYPLTEKERKYLMIRKKIKPL